MKPGACPLDAAGLLFVSSLVTPLLIEITGAVSLSYPEWYNPSANQKTLRFK
jgi:hypothetical protein